MSDMVRLIELLKGIVGEEGVVCDGDELMVYANDGFPIAKGLASAVVFPRSVEDVSACVKLIGGYGVQIIPRGSGTGLTGGSVGFGGGVIICTSRMKRIESIDIANRVAVVEAGVLNASLTAAVRATPGGEGLHFSPDPSSQAASTIGGNAATNAGGINTLKHGVSSSHILGVEVVLANGTVQTVRGGVLYDGVGGDLAGLYCGSEGTLGIIVRIWCRLTARPRHFRTMYAVYEQVEGAYQAVSDVIASGVVPSSMEMMDGAMVRVVEDAFSYGFPDSVSALLLIEIDGVEMGLDEQMDEIVGICRRNGALEIQQCSDANRREQLWSVRKRAFGAIGRISHSYCTQDACIPRSKLPEAMSRISELSAGYGMRVTNVFHAGDGNIHPILLFDEDDPEQVKQTLRLSEEILDYCISIGGTITGEHGVGVEKIHMMGRMFNASTIELFKEIKGNFDSRGVMNEGKLVPSDRLVIRLGT